MLTQSCSFSLGWEKQVGLNALLKETQCDPVNIWIEPITSCSKIRHYTTLNINVSYLPTHKNYSIQPSFINGRQFQITFSRRQQEGDAENLDGVAGHGPTTQQQQFVVKSPITWNVSENRIEIW
jgi:hypothetical protein